MLNDLNIVQYWEDVISLTCPDAFHIMFDLISYRHHLIIVCTFFFFFLVLHLYTSISKTVNAASMSVMYSFRFYIYWSRYGAA